MVRRLILLCWAFSVLASVTVARAQADKSKPARDDDEPKYAFVMEDMPLAKALDWLVEHTGLPYVTCIKPPTLTLTFPADKRGKTCQCTIGEVMDIVNDALVPQKYALIRGEIAFTLVPNDERTYAGIPRKIKIEDLKRYGRSEIVIVVLHVKGDAKRLAERANELLEPVGQVTFAPGKLALIDSVRNLQRVIAQIKKWESESTK
jgi:type II secretory pathway component GspD/PulD (secretin)